MGAGGQTWHAAPHGHKLLVTLELISVLTLQERGDTLCRQRG
jgi:hypothetical protein